MRVKEEAVELEQITWEDEDQMTLSHYFHSGRTNPIDPSPMEKLETTMETKKRSRGSKFESKRVLPDNPTKFQRCKRNKAQAVIDELYDNTEVQSAAVMKRAEEVQANLHLEFPSFVKLMLRSHVTKGFWLGLPSQFCKLHLPRHDETIVLEGESGEEYKTNFLADKGGLSGGWKGFSVALKLLEGDVVVFHLVRPCKFKVYVIRANGLAEVDGALGLLNLDPSVKENDFEEDIARCNKSDEIHPRPLSPDILEENNQTDQSENGREDLSSEETGNFGLSGTFDFEKFNIIVNGLSIESELSKHLQVKYYDLCYTRKSYLHHHLPKRINSTLAAGIIAETVNIADAIRACKISTSRDDFVTWVKTLEAFELLGMDVGFLRARLSQLMTLAFKSTEAAESKRYVEARFERDLAEEEMKTLESKMSELQQARIRLDGEIEALKVDKLRHELLFKEEANAPW